MHPSPQLQYSHFVQQHYPLEFPGLLIRRTCCCWVFLCGRERKDMLREEKRSAGAAGHPVEERLLRREKKDLKREGISQATNYIVG